MPMSPVQFRDLQYALRDVSSFGPSALQLHNANRERAGMPSLPEQSARPTNDPAFDPLSTAMQKIGAFLPQFGKGGGVNR